MSLIAMPNKSPERTRVGAVWLSVKMSGCFMSWMRGRSAHALGHCMPFAIIAPFRPHSQCSVMRCVHIAAVQTLNRPRVCSHRLRQPKVFETSEAFHRCVLIAGFDRRRKRAALLRSLDVRPFISEYLVFVFHILFVEPWPNNTPEPTAVGAFGSAVAVHAASRRWLSFFR